MTTDEILLPIKQAIQSLIDQNTVLSTTVSSLQKQVTDLTVPLWEKQANEMIVIGLSWGYLNIPYKFGGTYAKNNSFDCSGLTQALYGLYGIKLPHYSVAQSQLGSNVLITEIRVGDALFFDTNHDGVVNHCGIYDGKGSFLHTNKEGEPIRLELFDDTWKGRFINARRYSK